MKIEISVGNGFDNGFIKDIVDDKDLLLINKSEWNSASEDRKRLLIVCYILSVWSINWKEVEV